ncbi:MAG: hypothetical protein Q8L52_02845 [bacterium]|nr:hypothetical protein [bacterium]
MMKFIVQILAAVVSGIFTPFVYLPGARIVRDHCRQVSRHE